MTSFAQIPFAASNSHLTSDLVYLGIDDGLFVTAWDWREPVLLRRFLGADCGLRLIHRTSAGKLLCSPWGKGLADSQKGLWISPDNGTTWSRVLSLEQYPNPVCIWAFAEHPDGWLFAGIYLLGPDVAAAVIYRSADNGQTWAPVYSPGQGRHIHWLSVDPRTGFVYASIGDSLSPWFVNRILRSCDRGESWDEILGTAPQVVPIVCSQDCRFIGSDEPGNGMVFRTRDDVSFDCVLQTNGEEFFYWMRPDASTGAIYAGTAAGHGEARAASLYRHDPQYETWDKLVDLDPTRAFDGSQFASNLSESRILVHHIRSGEVQPTWLVETTPTGAQAPGPGYAMWLISQRLLALALLIALLPLLILVALMVWSSGPGSVLFRQVRRGLGGEPFRILKFRTMAAPAEKPQKPEPTKVGRLLRRLSIDELPQLINVALGHMALVGPRPHPLSLDDEYAPIIPRLRERYNVLPGISGLAQISGSRGSILGPECMQERINLDLDYIRRRSAVLDLQVLLKTVAFGFVDRSGLPEVSDRLPNRTV